MEKLLPMNYRYLDTPIGRLRLVSTGSHLAAIEFEHHHGEPGADSLATDAVLELAAAQLLEYFAGRRRRFELPLAAAGTAFQRQVWAALAAIPWGELRSYAAIARAIERPTAVRAVGAANGRNPLPIVIPCHRVVGSNGSLTGFAGGLGIKRQLLELEGSLGELPARR
jgi:methylated-DNA-[protein]-cysteine S-methyltransferase